MHGWLWLLEFSVEINFAGAVATCHFPSLVLPFLGRRRRYTDYFFKLQPSLVKALANWSKVLTVPIIFDGRLSWSGEAEIAIWEIAAINSSLSTCFSSSCHFFESFAPVCSAIAWIVGFWFLRNFCYRLCEASFCFRFVLHFLCLSLCNLLAVILWELSRV